MAPAILQVVAPRGLEETHARLPAVLALAREPACGQGASQLAHPARSKGAGASAGTKRFARLPHDRDCQ